MAVAFSNVTSGGDTDGNSTATTASISPSSNTLLLLTVVSRTGITANPNQPTATSNGLTWVAVDTKVYDDNSSSRRRITVLRSMGASPSTGTISIDFGGQNQTNVYWSLDEASGVDTSGTNGSGAVVQSANNYLPTGSPSTTLVVTLGAFSSVNNATFGAFGSDTTGSTFVVGSGFTQLTSTGDTSAAIFTEYKTANDTSVDTTFVSEDEVGGIGIEVRAAGLNLINVTTASGAAGTSPTVNTPTNISGDLLVVVISHNDGTVTVADNNGATPCTESLDYDIFAGGAGGAGIAIYYRVLGGSEPATFTFTLSGSQRWAMVAFTMRGQHADVYDVAPTGASNTATPGTTVNSNSVTTLTNNAWAISCGVIDSSTGTWNTGSPGGSWVEIATVNLQEPLKVAYLIKTTAGATGNIALTPVASTNISALKQFAIREAAVITVATKMQINIGDSWKTVTGLQINIGDTWKTVTKVQQNIGDTWKTVF